jgi:hypothetical protein
MCHRVFVFVVYILSVLAALTDVSAQDSVEMQAATHPMADFQRLIEGQWHIEGSFQEFEWGLGHRSVRSKAYFIVDGQQKLVSEGFWYWHPGDKAIKGVFTAIDMPVELFEYVTRFEDNMMINELQSFDREGTRSIYTETWEFTDDMHYEWKLLKKSAQGLQEMMGGTYTRKK